MRIPTLSLRLGAFALALALPAALPYIVWRFQRPRALNVVIVDKTVPFPNYREHAAFAWLLHANKIQGAPGRFLDPAFDYIGFDPRTRSGQELLPENVAHADLLFVADTYGVYTGDYARPGEQAALERSPKIYGGISDEEAHTMGDFALHGGLVIGEFNAFASPTEESARARVEALFGVRWTHWVGRYWPNLADEREVPRWVGRLYERVAHQPFRLQGGGLVFVHEDDDIVVLQDDEDLRSGILSQERTPAGAVFGFPRRGTFHYWLDVVESAGSEVLYEHVVDATPAGERKLAAHGLPLRFPALTRRWEAWYFAGDFVDTSMSLGSPERAGLLAFHGLDSGCGGASPEEATFWGWYAPIVTRLLLSRAH